MLLFQESTNRFANFMVAKDPKASKTILYWTSVIQTNNNYPCKLALIKGSLSKFGSEGMIFAKRWPWRDYFNYHLLGMKESGLINRFYERNKRSIRKIFILFNEYDRSSSMYHLSISCCNDYSLRLIS